MIELEELQADHCNMMTVNTMMTAVEEDVTTLVDAALCAHIFSLVTSSSLRITDIIIAFVCCLPSGVHMCVMNWN